MKKLFLSLVAAMMCATAMYGQGSLLATLSHDGEISAFYGVDALKSAMAAAENGDVITLSSGQFNAANIDKAVTLRGAGMSINTDSVNSHGSTLIQNNLTINLADTITGRLVMEGLYMKNDIKYSGHIKNAQFLKCRFSDFAAANDSAKMTNAAFIHCRIFYGFYMVANSSAYFVNCAVSCPRSEAASSSIEFDNCFVKFDDYRSTVYASNVVNSLYKNCIIQETKGRAGNSSYTYSNYAIPYTCTAYNCVGLGYSDLFGNMPSGNKTNKYVSNISSVFKSYNVIGYNTHVRDDYNFELTETAATTYLGLDGTQVGIYGGNLPYDENPTIPQITKCNVASKSTADGKLSVDIEVKAAAY